MAMESTLETQQQLVEAMKKSLINFKKESSDRKTPESIKRRIESLDLCWKEFQVNHEQLCQALDSNHQYFTGNYHEDTKKFHFETREFFQKSTIVRAATPLAIPKQKETFESPAASPSVSKASEEKASFSKYTSQGTDSKLFELMKKQTSNFKAFSRTVSQIDIDNIDEKWEFEDTLKSLQCRWKVIDSLHWEIDSELDGSDKGYEQAFTQHEKRFNSIKKAINHKLWSVSHREKSTPQLDIPVFMGNYQQWVSFKDLFCEAVHNNPSLSNAQKMQFLKSKLRGEAERLIQHLQISSENYQASWEILNHRYNNKKLIFTSHMNTMFYLPAMQQASSNVIKRIHDVTTECLNAIKNLGVNIDTWDPILVYILTQKLDVETHNDYMASLKHPRELPSIIDFLEYLENKFTTMESSRRKHETNSQKLNIPSTSGRQEKFNQNKQYHTSYKAITQSNKLTRNCPICNSNEHGIYYCKQFLEMTPTQKLQSITKLQFCVNCLYNHNGKACTSNKRCRECNGCHNTILHDPAAGTATSGPDPMGPIQQESSSHVAQQRGAPEILLATAMIKVRGADGVLQTMRALIDQGSQISIITENAAQQLGLSREKCYGVITGVGTKDTMCKGKTSIKCHSLTENYVFDTEVFIMKSLTRNLPNYTFTKPAWEYLENVQLADPKFYVSRPIDILLGAEVYSNIILEGIRSADNIRPVAQRTRLGWILCGKAQTLHCNVILNDIESIQRFWEIEDISENTSRSTEEEECIKIYKATTTRMEDRKYQVRLPLKLNIDELVQSKTKPITQFFQLERKFSSNKNIKTEYKLFMADYLTLGHMKPADSNWSPEYFLPNLHKNNIIFESIMMQLVEDGRNTYPASAHVSENCLYMDDLVHGAHESSSAPQLQQDLIELLKSGGFYLRKFTSNHQGQVNEHSQEQENYNFKQVESKKTLGLYWNSEQDRLLFQSTFDNPTSTKTKQKEIKETNQVYIVQQGNTKDSSIIKTMLYQYSSFSTVVRVLAWVRRFLTRKQESYLTLSELRQANIAIIKQVQEEEFGEKRKCITENKKNNQKQDCDIKRTRKIKRKTFSLTTIFTALLLFFISLPANSDCQANITKFRTNQGLFFDKVSNMHLIKDESKLVVYYELQPYWQGTKALDKYINALEKTCTSVREQALCNAVLLQLRHGYTELEYYNQVFLSQQHEARPSSPTPARQRVRRGLVNGIGYIASDLFGVLDERFSEQYKRDIGLLKDNQNHFVKLLKNQTLIVEAENNILRRTEVSMNLQHKIINQHIIMLDKTAQELKNTAQTNLILNDFTIGVMVASNLLHNLKSLQSSLLETITDIYRGRFKSNLLTPEQIIEELNTISSHLPKDVSLPVDNIQSDLSKIYELLRVRTRIMMEYLIFEIRVPLISRDTYDILKIIPIPQLHEGKIIRIVPVSSYVSMNMKKDTYIPRTENDVRACFVQSNTYFCHSARPEYQLREDKNLCELENSECKTEMHKSCKDSWQESYTINTYLYFCCEPCTIRVMCEDQMTAHQLTEAGLIHIGHGCLIKTSKFTVYPHKPHSSEMTLLADILAPTMAPINHVINISIPQIIMGNDSQTELHQHIVEVGNKIKTLQEKEDDVLRDTESISFHNVHHYVMIYIIFIVVGVFGVVIIIRRVQCRWQVPPSFEEAPIPMSVVLTTTGTPPPPLAARRAAACSTETNGADLLPRERQDRSTSPAFKRLTFSE